MEKRKNTLFFVLEESPVYRQIIPACLQAINEKGEVKVFDNPETMLSEAGCKPDLIVSEYTFSNPAFNGKDILNSIKEKSPATKVVFLTAHHDLISAVSAIKSGAYDYIPKSRTALDRLIQISLALKRKHEALRKSASMVNWLGMLLFITVAVLVSLVILYRLL